MRNGRTYEVYILIASLCILLLLLVKLRKKPIEGFAEYTLPKIIWSYWHDANIPPKIKTMLDDRKTVLSTWDHRVLNEETVYKYIPKDEFPKKYETLSHQHKADWIRLYILKIYGGCWMDASIIVNTDEELERLYSKSIQEKSEFTGFYLASHTLNSVKETYIENWFILAPVQSRVIELWLEEYTEAVEGGFLAYKKKVFSVVDVSNIYAKDDDNSLYLTQHAALQYILRHRLTQKPSILLFDASDTMFKPHIDCNWDVNCVIEYLKTTPKDAQPPYIKLRGGDRISL
jgi:hypothetical protein